jgi:hypothetical protein
MSVSGNFESVALAGKALTVRGSSVPLDNGELVSRHVAVSQSQQPVATGTDELLAVDDWKLEIPGGAGFSTDEPVLAVGVETYVLTDAVTQSGDKLPSFVSFTWSQILPIT